MGGDYSQVEWAQMGLLLIGLPVAAVMGAVAGHIGNWRRGSIVTSMLWGLGCAAGVSALGLVTFIISAVMPTATNGISWINVFYFYASWRLTIAALSAASVSALIAGVISRRRERGNSSFGAISLRQLLLIQIFAFAALGCWIGMRSYAIGQATVFEKASFKWGRSGWKVNGNSGGKVMMERTYEPASEDWKHESETLRRVCKEPWLGELCLFQLDNADALDFGAIADAENLNVLSLRYHPATMPPQSHIDAISQVSSLRELSISGGDFSLAALSPLLKLKSLKRIDLREVTYDEAALRDIVRALKLDHFASYGSNPRGKRSVGVAYWQGYLALTHYQGEVGADDLDWVEPDWLTRLQIDSSELTVEAAKRIAKMPNIDHVDLNCRVEGPALREISKCGKLRHAFIVQLASPSDRAAFDSALNEFLMSPQLQVIDWNWGVIKPELADPPPNEEELRLIALGQRPSFSFNLPATADQSAYVEEINRRRAERNLRRLTINPNDQMRQRLLSVLAEAP